MNRIASFLYGAFCYSVFLGAFLYAVGFVGNLVVPKSIDAGGEALPFGWALAINLGLLSLFAVQHSGMARQGFKRVWTRVVPKHVERATYTLAASLCLIAMYAFWVPMPETVWSIDNEVGRGLMWAAQFGGWAIVFLSTVMINHFDLFGMRQVWTQLKGEAYRELGFRTVGFYKLVRHPIQTGFLLAFWATPEMTVGHLLFSVVATAYIVVAVKHFEERDLIREHGARYRAYMERTPAFFPNGKVADPGLAQMPTGRTGQAVQTVSM